MAFYKPPVNYRSAPASVSGETFEIAGGFALIAEAPADPTNPAYPCSVTVGGASRTRVTGAPAAGQYRILTQTVLGADGAPHTEYLPVLQFNAADEGATGAASYWRTGTVLTAEFFDLLRWFLTPLSGVEDLSALQTSYPATNDVTRRGRPGDIAFLADGSMYFSSGLAWQQVGGVTPNSWTEALGLAPRFGFGSSAGFAATWAKAATLAQAIGFTAAESYIASGFLGAMSLAQAMGFAATSTFSAAWTRGTSLGAGLGLTLASDYSAGGGAPPLWSDDFSANTITNYTVGNAAGNVTIAGGVMKATAADNSWAHPTAGLLAAATDGSIEADVRTTHANADIGVYARCAVATNPLASTKFLWARWQGSTGALQLYHYTNTGGWNLIGSYAAGLVVGDTHNIKMTLNGSAVTVLLDGVQRISTTTSLLTSGYAGMLTTRADGSDEVSWDNFKVY